MWMDGWCVLKEYFLVSWGSVISQIINMWCIIRVPYNNIILNLIDSFIKSYGPPNIMVCNYVPVVGEPSYCSDLCFVSVNPPKRPLPIVVDNDEKFRGWMIGGIKYPSFFYKSNYFSFENKIYIIHYFLHYHQPSTSLSHRERQHRNPPLFWCIWWSWDQYMEIWQ